MAEVNKKDKQGNTPLHIACMLGRKDIVQLLLEKGAKVRSRNNAEWNALDEAKNLADVKKKDIQENTALHIACMLFNKEIARILLENGAKGGRGTAVNGILWMRQSLMETLN
ncbi:hypothetical protein niasHT_037965 [Heterodera trifolii]|uniref:Ankyrin repeat protein n=1 Tax=Heterodera trifolii TaxID=157864 RepID=A0ABD2HTH1_9BILA